MTKEGLLFPLPFLILTVVMILIFNWTGKTHYAYLSTIFFILSMSIMLFFRDPERKVPTGDKLIIAPADGKIIVLRDNDDGVTISTFMSVFNVHINRSPVDGEVKSVTFFPGKFLSAFKEDALKENQRNEIVYSTKSGEVRMHQVTGAIARRTIFNLKAGDKVTAGDKVGLIRFGSRVDLFLPAGSEIDVKLKQKVRGGETVIGRLP